MTCGNSSDLESAIKQVGAEGRVKILPNLDHFDLLNYTVNADIGVLLYANNDLGNYFQAPGRLTEYLACGLPILASDYAGLSSLVNKFGIGDCADPTSPQEIAAAILRIEAIRARGAMQPQQIRQTFLKHFAFERFAPSLLKAFDDLRYSGTDRKCGPPERVY
jgi:glycosyltransferase involved in cell wall biosynthesis